MPNICWFDSNYWLIWILINRWVEYREYSNNIEVVQPNYVKFRHFKYQNFFIDVFEVQPCSFMQFESYLFTDLLVLLSKMRMFSRPDGVKNIRFVTKSKDLDLGSEALIKFSIRGPHGIVFLLLILYITDRFIISQLSHGFATLSCGVHKLFLWNYHSNLSNWVFFIPYWTNHLKIIEFLQWRTLFSF